MFVRSVPRSRSLSFTRSALSPLVVLALASVAVLSGCSSASSADGSSQSSSSAAIQAEGPTIDATLIVKDPAAADAEGASYPVKVAQEEATVLAAVEASGVDAVIEDGPYGKYITSIGGKAAEGSSGWVYTVNGEQVMEAIDVCTLDDGDTVELEYLSM